MRQPGRGCRRTKKKELAGECRNNGLQWRPAADPAPVNVHDFAVLDGQGRPVRDLRSGGGHRLGKRGH
ncbi:hypothetical protein GTY81_23855 [Streptomyces sp. SID8366]|nr:hypothetical protein [Streptomyces sp. SID8366]MYU64701.1 hypothetical protein [Streptomyces sp. SID69]